MRGKMRTKSLLRKAIREEGKYGDEITSAPFPPTAVQQSRPSLSTMKFTLVGFDSSSLPEEERRLCRLFILVNLFFVIVESVAVVAFACYIVSC